MGKTDDIILGSVTVLVDVSSTAPLSLTGTIEKKTAHLFEVRHGVDPVVIAGPIHVDPVHVEGEIEEEETFLIVNVTATVLPTGFPLSNTQLIGTDVAINLDRIIMILPVEIV